MEDLATVAGIKKGSLYHIESKEQFLFEIAEQILPKFIANATMLLDNTQLEVEQKLRTAIIGHFEVLEMEGVALKSSKSDTRRYLGS